MSTTDRIMRASSRAMLGALVTAAADFDAKIEAYKLEPDEPATLRAGLVVPK